MTKIFSNDQIACLTEMLDKSVVRQRKQGSTNVSYIEGWWAISEANRIFGFGNWMRETISMDCVWSDNGKCTYVAKVRITVQNDGGTQIIREGTGAGHGNFKSAGDNHESATKEAETDAMKRALMTFGNPFGLALYDKDKRDVTKTVKKEQYAPEFTGASEQVWCEQMIEHCNGTEWDKESFGKWKGEIREQFKNVRNRNPESAQELQDTILEMESKIREKDYAK